MSRFRRERERTDEYVQGSALQRRPPGVALGFLRKNAAVLQSGGFGSGVQDDFRAVCCGERRHGGVRHGRLGDRTERRL
jgi:hypothetical protein